ncbi:MAG: ArsR/SmtB family transcription factor [Candidatus Puniceispirillales bacterium]
MKIRSDTNHVTKIFHALSHPLRLSICLALRDTPKSVNELCALLEVKQYMISQQLSILREADIVDHKRQSRQIIYSIASANIIALIDMAFDEKDKKINMQLKAKQQKKNAFSEFARIL